MTVAKYCMNDRRICTFSPFNDNHRRSLHINECQCLIKATNYMCITVSEPRIRVHQGRSWLWHYRSSVRCRGHFVPTDGSITSHMLRTLRGNAALGNAAKHLHSITPSYLPSRFLFSQQNETSLKCIQLTPPVTFRW